MINEMAKQNIIRCVQVYGIEGTEDKIKELYSEYLDAKNLMLSTLYDLYGFGFSDYDEKEV